MSETLSTKQLRWRYATKKFNAEKSLSAEKIETIKQSFNLTATSYGLQPLKLVIIQDKKIQESLVEHSWNQRQVVDASHLLVICIERTLNAEYIKDYFTRVKDIRNTPDEIIKPFQAYLLEDFEGKSTQDIQEWSKNQAYLAMGNLLTICALEEIDSCPMEGFTPEKYDEILNLEAQNLMSVLVMPIGYRADDDMFATFKKVRRPLEDTIIELKHT